MRPRLNFEVQHWLVAKEAIMGVLYSAPVPSFLHQSSRAQRMGRGRGRGWWRRLVSLSLLAGFATAGLAERPAADAPAVALDAIFESNGMPTIGARELAVRYLQMPAAGLSANPGSLGFRRIPREGGTEGDAVRAGDRSGVLFLS